MNRAMIRLRAMKTHLLFPAAVVCSIGFWVLSFGGEEKKADPPSAKKAPIEIGLVAWERDIDAAKKASAQSGKPLLVLFQEVPGCAGCRQFGRDVLSDKRMVAAIEEGFVPVVVYNNQPGKDAALLGL